MFLNFAKIKILTSNLVKSVRLFLSELCAEQTDRQTFLELIYIYIYTHTHTPFFRKLMCNDSNTMEFDMNKINANEDYLS